jgi:hypothetical protein
MTSGRARRAAVALVALVASACGQDPPAPAACEGVGSQAMSASAEGRWLLGLASRYPADTALGARADEIHRSQRARRAVAWEAVARTLAPVPLAHPTGVADATVPRFQTWYDRADVSRTFQRLYGGLDRQARDARARFTDGALDEAFGFNVGFVNTLPEWSAARLDAYATSLDNAAAVAGVSGVLRIALSPDAVRHLITSYPEILRCIASGAPPSFADGPAASQQVAREPVALPRCGARVLGPYFVASGGDLTARLTGAAPGAELSVLDGVTPTAAARCTAPAATGCAITGPGLFMVRVTARGEAASGVLDVRYTPPTTDVAACLHGVFPPAAATVALEWRRTDLGMPLPTYDTSAAGIARRLAPGADATWGTGDGTAEPGPGEAYTMRLAAGSSFRLAGMHIRTRELSHWLNITLWWSPRPDEDFGADRPASVRALGGPWSSYKMCVATDFDEQDPDPAGGFAQDAPSLGAALRAVHEGQGGPSWCSNPYIDGAPGLVRSNCVGCHQHAMSGVLPEEVQTNHDHYPANGRAQVRNNQPADGFWGIDGGDHIGAVFAETVEYWRTAL